MQMYRQGDVAIIRIDQIPAEAVEQKGRVVLAYGEITGHAHAIEEGATMLKTPAPVPVFDWRAERFLRVQVQALLKHEEHGTVTIPAGDYAVVIQREYTPEELRNVQD